MSRKYEPSPVQLCLALGDPVPALRVVFVEMEYIEPGHEAVYPEFDPAKHASLKVSDACEMGAVRFGQDQYRCGKCGMVWDIDETRPPCQDTSDNTGGGAP